jgi:hypothetical protein
MSNNQKKLTDKQEQQKLTQNLKTQYQHLSNFEAQLSRRQSVMSKTNNVADVLQNIMNKQK